VAVVELTIPARTDYLALVRLVVSACASIDPPLPESRLDDLRLVVSEACANAVDAHVGTYADGPVVVRCELAPHEMVVTITDRGGGFDPAALGDLPPVHDPRRLRHERGLGLPLMRVLADTVEFTPSADGTSVRLAIAR
jgi:serine/threonine-protein kinase RsbW